MTLPAPTSRAWPGELAGFLAVALVAGLGYAQLYAGIDIDDTGRFAYALRDGRWQWSASHVLMQPATRALHLLAGSPADLLLFLRLVSTAAAAVSLGLVFLVLRRAGLGRAVAVLACAAAGLSFAVLQLATSGHVKLIALPWLLGALALLAAPGPARVGRLAAAGALLGIGAGFLISFVLLGPALAAAWLAEPLRRRDGRGLRRAVGEIAVVAAAMAAALGLVLALGFALHTPQPGAGGAFLDWFFADRTAFAPPTLGAAGLARLGFGLLGGFVFVYRLPELLRARWAGEPVSPWALGPAGLYEAGLVLAVGLLLAVVAAACWVVLRRGRRGEAAVVWALAAMLLFMLAWSHFEADFQFPLVVLAAMAVALAWPGSGGRATLLAAAVALGGHNLGAYALPRLAIDTARTQAGLAALVGPADLVVSGGAFTGRHALYHYGLARANHLRVAVDLLALGGIRDAEPFYRALEAQVAAALARGGRVYVFALLDPADWGPPWALLHRIGVDREGLAERLGRRWRIGPARTLEGLVYHEILPAAH